jgi:hypothetical protein
MARCAMMRGMKPTHTALLQGLPLWLPLFPALFLALCFPTRAAAAEAPWAVAGQQGLVRLVIVPTEQAKESAAYQRQITLLCGGTDRTCFLNFYTNSSGAVLAVPLPDAISNEPTAVFRRSNKQQGEYFRFSCRMQLDLQNCF